MAEGLVLPTPEGIPKRIGKYRILRQIAQGGMAEIYLASATGIEGFEKLCVLKRILPLLASNAEFVQMFLDEARIAASLLHSNIAQVFDIGSDNGSYYFVMEFLRGEDVRHILQSSLAKQSFVPYEHVVSMIAGVCSGLHYAHEMRGKDGKPLSLVHRDISPQNIFVTHDGNVKLCDFGIAKSAAQLTETRVGTLKGKIRYMSPEQCSSEPLDRRSDIFALSIVLWELVTLRRLFSGKSDFEIFKAIVEETPPRPSGMRSDVPEGLEHVIMKGLSRRPEDRFQTAQEMQLALEDWAREARVPASSVRLAGFMTDLFGPPASTVESFLEKVTSADPLAKHIKQLNAREDSNSGPIDVARASQRNIAVRSDEDDEVTRHEGSSPARTFSELEGSLSIARSGPPRGVVLGAAAIFVAAFGLLGWRMLRPDVRPVPVATAPTAPVIATPKPSKSAEPSELHAPPPVDSIDSPVLTTSAQGQTPPPSLEPTRVQHPSTPVRRVVKKVDQSKRNDPAKPNNGRRSGDTPSKPGDLDGLFPP